MSGRLLCVAVEHSDEPREVIQLAVVELDAALDVVRLASWLVWPCDWSGVTPACCQRTGVDLDQLQRLGADWVTVLARFNQAFGGDNTIVCWGHEDGLDVLTDTINATAIDLSSVYKSLFASDGEPTMHQAMAALELNLPDGLWDAGANALATALVWKALAERVRS